MDVKFKIENQIISRTDRVRVVADSKNYLRAVFAFTPEWGGLTKTAIFGNNNNYYEMLLDGDACMIPAEVIKPPYFSVSVVAGDRITANIATVDVIASGYREGETPAEPTPDVYAQIIANMEQQAVDAERAEDAQRAAEGARDDAQGYATQTERDKQAVAQDKSDVAADRRAVDDALTEFATVTLPEAVQTVEDKADAEVIRVEQAGDAQVTAVELSGAEQTAAAKEQGDRAERGADRAEDEADRAETEADRAGNNILNGVSTHNDDMSAHPSVQADIRNVEAIARGKARSIVFDTRDDMYDWLSNEENAVTLEIGDNLYIRDIGVPDYWWDGSAPAELEAEAPDLINYPTKIEFYANLPLPIEESDYQALINAGTVQAGRIYYVVPDGTLEG